MTTLSGWHPDRVVMMQGTHVYSHKSIIIILNKALLDIPHQTARYMPSNNTRVNKGMPIQKIILLSNRQTLKEIHGS